MAIAESMYGSDRGGLVCGYLFKPGAPGRAIESEATAAHLAGRLDGAAEFLWLHFSLANAGSEHWLRQHVALPQAFYDSLKERTSTRVEVVDDELLAVVNDVQYFAAEASSAATVTLYVTDRIIVSARTTQLRAIDRLRASVKHGAAFHSPVGVLAHLLRDQADVLVEIVHDATKQVDVVEDRIIGHQSTSRPRLGALRRVLVRLQRLLAPEPAALFRLLNRPPSWVSETDLSDLRQSAEELSTAVSDSAALVERIRLLQEELIALLNEQTNQTLFILTVVTLLALPLTIIPGLFGMNVRGIPFSGHDAGFWLVLLVMIGIVGLAAALAWTRLRR
jgi:zinc transporter